MTDLIARLEEAAEGSHRLDAQIAGAVSVAILMDEDWSHTGPHYTTSIDAALTLVPEGWYVSIAYQDHNDANYSWNVAIVRKGQAASAESGPRNSFALALCIAALRARQSET